MAVFHFLTALKKILSNVLPRQLKARTLPCYENNNVILLTNSF